MSERTLDSVRSELLEKADKLRELRETATDQRSDVWEREVRYGVSEINALDAEHKALSVPEAPKAPESQGPQGAFRSIEQYKSAGTRFTESEEYKGRRSRESSEYVVEGGVRALLTSGLDPASTPASGLFAPVGSPVLNNVRQRRLFVRDLVSVVPTSLNSVPYILEKNIITNELGANVVAEAGTKPEVVLEFDRADAIIRKIAGWVPVTTEIMDDAPTLRGYIDARLGYMVAIREEQQVINGSGTAPQLRGIRNFTGVQTQAALADATGPADVPKTVGNAIKLIENVDGYPDAVVMTPTDFWEGLTTRYANQFDSVAAGAGQPVVGRNPRDLWDLPVVTTRAATADEALVGDYRMGATLFDRQQTVIKVTDSHDDYFVNNKLVILAEERVGLAVHRPDFFVKAGLGAVA